MKYYISNKEVLEKEFYERLEKESFTETENTFDDLLNDCYEEYHMGSLTVQPCEIAKTDMAWYDEALLEQQNFDLDDLKYMLNNDGQVCINNILFKLEEDESE